MNCFENTAEFKYSTRTVINKHLLHEEFKHRINSERLLQLSYNFSESYKKIQGEHKVFP
jgi:hypothetical protein